MKKRIWIWLLFFLAGILLAELLGKQFFITYGFLSEYHLKNYAAATMDRMALFWNVFWERGKLFLLIALICATPLRRLIPAMIKGVVSFIMGLFAAASTILLGVYGILLSLTVFLPHGIFYLGAILLIYGLKPMYAYEGKRKNARFFLQILLIWILFAAACLIETLLGTWLQQTVLRFIYR